MPVKANTLSFIESESDFSILTFTIDLIYSPFKHERLPFIQQAYWMTLIHYD